MRRDILVTGGTGKTGRRLADRLRKLGASPRVATRAPGGRDQVRFDWMDPTSYAAAVEHVCAVYLVAPSGAADPFAAMRPFIDHARSSGVDRFVLLSASMLEEGGPMMGAVHAYLKDHAPAWTVLRPTWFMQNFTEQQHLPKIRDEGVIYSATGDGRVPFIDAADIANVAAEALVNAAFPNGDLILGGPAALSYDEVADLISGASGKRVRHQELSEDELAARLRRDGLDATYARVLAAMDTAIAAGSEDRTTDAVQRSTGQRPAEFATFANEHGEVWR